MPCQYGQLEQVPMSVLTAVTGVPIHMYIYQELVLSLFAELVRYSPDDFVRPSQNIILVYFAICLLFCY